MNLFIIRLEDFYIGTETDTVERVRVWSKLRNNDIFCVYVEIQTKGQSSINLVDCHTRWWSLLRICAGVDGSMENGTLQSKCEATNVYSTTTREFLQLLLMALLCSSVKTEQMSSYME